MNPIIRISVLVAALAGILSIGRAMWPAVANNLTALRSWARTEGVVREVGDKVQFEIGREPSSYHAYAEVDHTWDLGEFRRVPLFVDPADPSRVKPAGFLQMWLFPAEMTGLMLLLLAIALIAGPVGTGHGAAGLGLGQAQWMFTPSPGPLGGGISLHSPARRWKDVLLLSLVMPVLMALSATSSRNQAARFAYVTLGAAFALGLWIYAWHTKTMEVSADGQGVRVTSVLGWRDVPWEKVRSVEDQEILRAYYNSNSHMWELPFPGSTARVFAFNDQQGRPLMHFSPELEPKDGMRQLFELCTRRTGLVLRPHTITLRY